MAPSVNKNAPEPFSSPDGKKLLELRTYLSSIRKMKLGAIPTEEVKRNIKTLKDDLQPYRDWLIYYREPRRLERFLFSFQGLRDNLNAAIGELEAAINAITQHNLPKTTVQEKGEYVRCLNGYLYQFRLLSQEALQQFKKTN